MSTVITPQKTAKAYTKPHVPRPMRKVTAQASLSKRDVIRLHDKALCHMSCAMNVLELRAEHADSASIFGMRDLLRMYYDKAKKADEVGEVGDLIDGMLPDMSADIEKVLRIVERINDEEMDDGILHAVEYLLTMAKAIADGEHLGGASQ